MMNQQDIFKKIGNILTEINEQYQFLAQNPDQLNDLEVELFLANANFLSDHVQIVKKLNVLHHATKPNVENDNLLLAEQNTIVLPIPMPVVEQEEMMAKEKLNEIAEAEEEEERIDIEQEQVHLDEDEIHEQTAEKIVERDFFKPDQDDHSFEFVLGNHEKDDKFDYEDKYVEDIFDRPLSKAEEEILAQKKKIHDKEDLPTAQGDVLASDDDEIGPEPFLIPHDEVESTAPETVTMESIEPLESLKDINLDEEIISPPVVEEKPAFMPEAVPIKPIVEPTPTKPVQSLNELLAQTNNQKEPVVVPILDLKQGINLNEKLLFIKDLFNGYHLAYSEAIDIVNKMKNFETADTFLQSNYAVKNNWAAKQSSVDQFYQLLNRRFSN